MFQIASGITKGSLVSRQKNEQKEKVPKVQPSRFPNAPSHQGNRTLYFLGNITKASVTHDPIQLLPEKLSIDKYRDKMHLTAKAAKNARRAQRARSKSSILLSIVELMVHFTLK